MGIRDVQTIEFDSLVDYLQFANLQYHLQTGVKICNLKPINDDKYECKYINLF